MFKGHLSFIGDFIFRQGLMTYVQVPPSSNNLMLTLCRIQCITILSGVRVWAYLKSALKSALIVWIFHRTDFIVRFIHSKIVANFPTDFKCPYTLKVGKLWSTNNTLEGHLSPSWNRRWQREKFFWRFFSPHLEGLSDETRGQLIARGRSRFA